MTRILSTWPAATIAGGRSANRDSEQDRTVSGARNSLLGGTVEAMADIEEIVEPLVQHHVDAPAAIELRAAVARELAELVVRVPIAAGDRFHESSIVVDTQNQVRIGHDHAA